MSREFKREVERRRSREERGDREAELAALQQQKKRERTGTRQFLREVRGEMKRVAWPSRQELISYSIVVLVAVTILTLYVFVLDQAFGQLVLRIFGE